jgi:hypothetical protein
MYACSEWVSVMSVIQHSELIHRVVLSSVACQAPFFFILPHKRRDFRKNFTENKMCFFFTNFVDIFLILIRTERNVGFHVKHLSFLSGFTETGIFLDRFPKINQIGRFHTFHRPRSPLGTVEV